MNQNQPIMTPPMGVTKLVEAVYFVCTMPQASMHRPDGKRIPFRDGFFKAELKEDRDYLDAEIAGGNSVVRRCNPEEIQQAKMNEDPLGTLRESVKEEVIQNLTTEALEKLLAEKKARSAVPDPRVAAARAQAQALIKPASTAEVMPGGSSNSPK